MELHQAIELIQYDHLPQPNPALWADLGCGTGLFTYALAALLTNPARIYAIDKKPVSLQKQTAPDQVTIVEQQLDFVNTALNLPVLDGILMANSLHFVSDKTTLIHQLSRSLKDDGGFLIVEYDTDIPNPWVPYPVSYDSLTKLFRATGFSDVTWINERPSLYGQARLYAVYAQKTVVNS